MILYNTKVGGKVHAGDLLVLIVPFSYDSLTVIVAVTFLKGRLAA